MISLMRMRVVRVATVVGLLALAACGSQRSDSAAGDDPPADVVSDDYTGRFSGANLTILSSPDHGPQLCSAVAESYPPQCGGPDIEGWDWSVVDHESARGTSWGAYDVTGTFDDGVFTLTEPPAAPTPPDADDDFGCPEPCDPATDHTPRELRQIADQIAADLPDVQSVWSDPRAGTVGVTVWVAYESLWQQLAAEHGADVIDLDGVLQPIDDHE
ncbi:MAG: hypothetical protein ACRDPQ_20535 [Nocardioidaceae bacterium]